MGGSTQFLKDIHIESFLNLIDSSGFVAIIFCVRALSQQAAAEKAEKERLAKAAADKAAAEKVAKDRISNSFAIGFFAFSCFL